MTRTAALIAALSAALLAAPALAAERVALLIGNSAYPGAPGEAGKWTRLDNAANDVRLVGETLRNAGFEVVPVPNGDRAAIREAVNKFAPMAAHAKVAVLYFAGHGFEYRRRSYLVPTDAPVAPQLALSALTESYVDFEELVADTALAKLNVVFVDACRDTPRSIRFGEGGDAAAAEPVDDVDFPAGAQVAIQYSAALGKRALDAAPPPTNYSPFAWAVSQYIGKPHLEVVLAMQFIQQAVQAQTRDFFPPQQPYSYTSTPPGSYLIEPATPQPAAAPAAVAAPPNPPAPLALEDSDYETIDAPLLVGRALAQHGAARLETLARQRDPIAAYYAGYMRLQGIGVPRDTQLAREYMEAAAASGSRAGKLGLAYLLRLPGTNADEHRRSVALYEETAAAGSPKALGQLADIMIRGDIVEATAANRARGQALMVQAADRGYPYAVYRLALDGREDAGGPRTAQLREIAAHGNAAGDEFLCDLAARLGRAAEALETCRKAGEGGSSLGQARLAIAYHDGLGTARDSDAARHWTRLALSQKIWPSDELPARLRGYGYRFEAEARPGH